MSIPNSEPRQKRRINHRLDPHVLCSRQSLHSLCDLGQVLRLQFHHRRNNRHLRISQFVVSDFEFAQDFIDQLDPVIINQDVDEIRGVGLEFVLRCELVDNLIRMEVTKFD